MHIGRIRVLVEVLCLRLILILVSIAIYLILILKMAVETTLILTLATLGSTRILLGSRLRLHVLEFVEVGSYLVLSGA